MAQLKDVLGIFLIFFLTMNGYAQISFEPGYFIDNNDQRVECLIKNIDWKNNPTEFMYKMVETNEPIMIGIESVKEFGVTNTSHKYYRFTVGIERSSEVASGLSADRSIYINNEQVYLRPLIEGKASLYVYEDRGIIKYFYSYDEGPVEQLIYKKYMIEANRIGEINKYKEQLWNNLKCESISMAYVENMVYKKQSLIKFFTKYNQCHNSESVISEVKEDQDNFNLMIRPGLNKSALSMANRLTSSRDIEFGSKSSLRLGLELEFVLPFNKNKWSLLIEPTYQSFKDEGTITRSNQFNSFTSYNVDVNYTSIEVPFGIRHYFFLSKKSRIFVNYQYMVDLSMGSTIDYYTGNNLVDSYEIGTRGSSVLGAGYNYNNRFNLELRYGSRDILNSYNFWNSDYSTLSLILGVAIF